jgi:hypothetical protein
LADLRVSNDAMRDHWFLPYFITAALRISSSVFFHTPPRMMMRILAGDGVSGQADHENRRRDANSLLAADLARTVRREAASCTRQEKVLTQAHAQARTHTDFLRRNQSQT